VGGRTAFRQKQDSEKAGVKCRAGARQVAVSWWHVVVVWRRVVVEWQPSGGLVVAGTWILGGGRLVLGGRWSVGEGRRSVGDGRADCRRRAGRLLAFVG